jgi:predicted transcriptional regulator of viral defense system
VLRPHSYISLESALVDRGVTTQNPSILTCVTQGYPKTFKSRSVTIVYRRIATDLFWGFEEKATRYNTYRIAEPEKALLDWIYLNRQEGLPTPSDELNLQFLDLQKLRKYAAKFPRTVNEDVKDLLLDHTLVATAVTVR